MSQSLKLRLTATAAALAVLPLLPATLSLRLIPLTARL